jgi:hypothetical protein
MYYTALMFSWERSIIMAKYLADFTVLDAGYQNGVHQIIIGTDAGTTGNFTSINDPVTTGINTVPDPNPDPPPPADPLSKDPVVFSYTISGAPRVLMGKIITDLRTTPQVPDACLYSVITPPATPSAPWTPATAEDVVLQYPSGTPQARNPHGVADAGNFLYIIDYKSQLITILGKTELDGLTQTAKVLNTAPFDVGAAAGLDDDAKGQAIIALSNGGTTYLFALYIINDADGDNYEPSVLVKLSVNASTGALTFVSKVALGLNSVEIIPVTVTTSTGDEIRLLIPEIGGYQSDENTNGALSTVLSVTPFASAALPPPATLLTGDPSTTPHTAYDIRAIAAPRPGSGTSTVYLLTASYAENYAGTNWTLYQTSISRLIGAGGITLSAAIAAGILTVVDSDTSTGGSKGYYWDILFENGTVDSSGTIVNVDRLWFFRGSPILVTLISAYSTSNAANFAAGTGPGTIGGQNINSVDLITETLSQAAAGVSLKRSMGGGTALTASAASSTEEEEQ